MKRLAWATFGLAAALSATGIALLVPVPAEALAREHGSFALQASFAAILVMFGLVGAVVASRLPANPVGWLFLALGLLNGVFELAFGYASHATEVTALPGMRWAAWTAEWVGTMSPPFLVAALLLFPDGRLPTPRWRWVLWLCGPLLALNAMRWGLAPGPLDGFPSIENPAGIAGAEWLADLEPEPLITVLLIAAAAGLAVRLYRSRGVERQQVKWLALSAGLLGACLAVGGLVRVAFDGDVGNEPAAGFVFAACICCVPIAAGVAILRHRLYDIDVVINRTLVYGALTALLGATYLGLVLLSGLAVGDSDVAIAGATLAVAALFRPARERIQAGVDRRFYRRRYDAERTLEAFAGRLRDEVDLEALGADLRGVARETLQPVHLSLWLREAP